MTVEMTLLLFKIADHLDWEVEERGPLSIEHAYNELQVNGWESAKELTRDIGHLPAGHEPGVDVGPDESSLKSITGALGYLTETYALMMNLMELLKREEENHD